MANEYLKRKPTSTGNRRVFTWSAWIKKDDTEEGFVFAAGTSNSNRFALDFDALNDDCISFVNTNTSNTIVLNTERKLRDLSSWAHFLAVVDTTRLEQENRVRLYINGEETNFQATQTYPSINEQVEFNKLHDHVLGVRGTYALSHFFSGQLSDVFMVDGQALTPDVFGFYKEGKGYISAGSTQTTDFRPGQWVPKTPRVIKSEINRKGGFGVNGYYLPMNDSSNFGADFHTTPDTIITLKGEDLPQPKNGAPTTTDAYVSQLRTDPYAANLVLAVPGITGAPGAAHTDFSANIKGSGTNKVVTANGNAGVAVTASYYGSALSFDGTGDYLSIPDNSDFGFGSGDFTIEYWINHNASTSSAHTFDLRSSGDEDSVTVFYTSPGPSTLKVYLDGADKISVTDELKQNQWTHHAIERVGSTLTFYQNGVAAGINTVSGGTLRSSAPAIVGAKRDATASLNGYMQDFRVYKGVAKYKGGFDVPKPYTPVGISTWRAVSDCTANNFATFNPISGAGSGSQFTFTDGNLTATTSTSNKSVTCNVGMSTGKWYWEYSPTQIQNFHDIGISSLTDPPAGFDDGTLSASWRTSTGQVRQGNADVQATGLSASAGDIVQIAFNAETRKIWVGVNGSYYNSGDPAAGTNSTYGTNLTADEYFFASSLHSGGSGSMSGVANFGQNPTFSGNTTAGTYADSNGKGLFKYEPPTDFLALCEDNLPTPVIADPGKYFKTVLYEGDGNNGRSIVGVGFTPDLVWIKSRTNGAQNHGLYDSVRGAGYRLLANLTQAEDFSSNKLKSFSNDGFVTDDANETNEDGNGFVAWCWQAGAGTTSTNTAGSVDSVISVNQDAGFSIVSYTGTGSAASVGHGLGKKPSLVIAKGREVTNNWLVWHKGLTAEDYYLHLETTGAQVQNSAFFSAFSDTTFTLGSSAHINSSGKKNIAYCWAEIEGFSKFGSYVGNGDADGPFVYCGFKPAFVMAKVTTSTGNWNMWDSSRSPINPANNLLRANSTAAEITNYSYADIDILSNGFKLRTDSGDWNGNAYNFVFMAFAESPFTTANAK